MSARPQGVTAQANFSYSSGHPALYVLSAVLDSGQEPHLSFLCLLFSTLWTCSCSAKHLVKEGAESASTQEEASLETADPSHTAAQG